MPYKSQRNGSKASNNTQQTKRGVKMKKYIIGATLIALGAIIMFSRSDTAPTPSIEVGKKAPAFTLKDVDGKDHSLDEYLKSKYTVLIFIATQCPISNAYNERMAALHNDYTSKQIAFVGINSNKQEDVEEIKEHSAKNSFKFPMLKDWNNVVADAYGAQLTPEIFVLDNKGVLQYHGRIDDWYVDFGKQRPSPTLHDLEQVLEAILRGDPVPKATAPAVGCYIPDVP